MVVGNKGNNGVCERWLSVCGGFYVCGGPVYGDVKVVQSVVLFGLCREM